MFTAAPLDAYVQSTKKQFPVKSTLEPTGISRDEIPRRAAPCGDSGRGVLQHPVTVRTPWATRTDPGIYSVIMRTKMAVQFNSIAMQNESYPPMSGTDVIFWNPLHRVRFGVML